jgi:hypothetical protein
VSGGPLPAVLGPGQVLAAARVLPAPEPVRPFLPEAGLRRGSLVGVSGPGGMTLLLSLLVEPITAGSWAAVIGLPDLGLEASAAMGVDLGRIALVPDPGSGWASVAAAALDALDVVVLRPPRHCRAADAHRLAARARERGSVLLLAGPRSWPERPDLELATEVEGWEGLGEGSGTLRRRRGRIVVSGRRAAGRPAAVPCWLPGPDGRLTARHPRVERARQPVRAEELESIAWAG